MTLRDVGEEDTIDSKLKSIITHARMRKRKEIARERIAKRLPPQPKNTVSIKKVRNPGLHVTFMFWMIKWWTVVTSIQPYTCAANRYAKMRSNRRFKPGD